MPTLRQSRRRQSEIQIAHATAGVQRHCHGMTSQRTCTGGPVYLTGAPRCRSAPSRTGPSGAENLAAGSNLFPRFGARSARVRRICTCPSPLREAGGYSPC
jgi:hypothetical protein